MNFGLGKRIFRCGQGQGRARTVNMYDGQEKTENEQSLGGLPGRAYGQASQNGRGLGRVLGSGLGRGQGLGQGRGLGRRDGSCRNLYAAVEPNNSDQAYASEEEASRLKQMMHKQ